MSTVDRFGDARVEHDAAQHDAAELQVWPVWITLLLFAALGSAPFISPPWRIIPAVVVAVATVVVWRASAATAYFGCAVALIIGLLSVPGAWALWPAPLLAAIVGYLVVRRLDARTVPDPLSLGRLDLRIGVVMAAFVITSAVALFGWWLLVRPDLSYAVGRLPDVPPYALVLGAVAFAALNAMGEEFIWRGFGAHALELAGVGVGVAIVVQALSFGLVHIYGFPHGWIGVGLATIFGAMMGVLRWLSGGMLVPWMAHVAADLVIFAVLATVAMG